MNGYIAVPRATISAHRLWTNLWMRLGQAEDNSGGPGGNCAANDVSRTAIHSAPVRRLGPGTGHVDGRTPTGLRRHQMSPASTVPMTTTSLYFTDIPSTKQASRAASRAARWHVPRTGGSFA